MEEEYIEEEEVTSNKVTITTSPVHNGVIASPLRGEDIPASPSHGEGIIATPLRDVAIPAYRVSEIDMKVSNELRTHGNELLGHGNASYPPEVKIAVVRGYIQTGSLMEACKYVDPPLPYNVIARWKNRSTWWDALVQRLQHTLVIESGSAFTRVLHEATAQLLDMLRNGKRVVRKNKDGTKTTIRREPLAPAELARLVQVATEGQKVLYQMTEHAKTGDPEVSAAKQINMSDIFAQLERKGAE